MEIANNLDLILKKQDESESVKRAETDKAVEAAISQEKSEIARRTGKFKCQSCGRGLNDCHCRLVKEARGVGKPHGRKAAHQPDQTSQRAAQRRKNRRKMQKRSRRINRCR